MVDDQFAEDIAMITDGINLLYRIASYYVWLANAPHIAILSRANGLLFSTCHKNLVAFYSSLKLTRIGLFGPARTILRHVYESLLIAKFSSVSHDNRVLERWKQGDVIYFTNAVLKKIRRPDTEPFKEFWELMSGYSHATIYAQQVSLNVESTPTEVPLNLVYLRTLLDCQYHVLTSHFITPSMQYYAKRYARAGSEVPALKRKMSALLKSSRAGLLDRPREIIRNYRATWEVAA